MVSLTDLVNLDFVRSLRAAGTLTALVHGLIHLGVCLPDAVVLTLFLVLSFFIHCFLLYLTVGILVQYAHVHLRSASVLERLGAEGMTDEAAQRAIRRAAACAAVALVALGWAASGGRPSALEVAMERGLGEVDEKQIAEAYKHGSFQVESSIVSSSFH